MTVLGVLMAIAMPNMQTFILSKRLSSDVNGFVGLINCALSKAFARNQDVIICPKSKSGITCEASQFCEEYEVQIFVDVNGNRDRNTTDTLLKTILASDTTSTGRRLTPNSGSGSIKLSAVGLSQTAHRFDVLQVNAPDSAFEPRYGRSICISLPGRPRVAPLRTVCIDF